MALESLVGPSPLPSADALRAATKTLAAVLEHMETAKTFTAADRAAVKNALEVLGNVRPDNNPMTQIP